MRRDYFVGIELGEQTSEDRRLAGTDVTGDHNKTFILV
jgi:hypothetical protein